MKLPLPKYKIGQIVIGKTQDGFHIMKKIQDAVIKPDKLYWEYFLENYVDTFIEDELIAID